MKHKHAELIKAWADGAQIECRSALGGWLYTSEPDWHENHEYRIKPEPKPDVVLYANVHSCYENRIAHVTDAYADNRRNLKIVFDGATGEPKSAEVWRIQNE